MYEMHNNPSNVIDHRVSTFVKQGLVSLFENLLTNGKLSALEPLYVGAAIEEVDILDLQQAIEKLHHVKSATALRKDAAAAFHFGRHAVAFKKIDGLTDAKVV